MERKVVHTLSCQAADLPKGQAVNVNWQRSCLPGARNDELFLKDSYWISATRKLYDYINEGIHTFRPVFEVEDGKRNLGRVHILDIEILRVDGRD